VTSRSSEMNITLAFEGRVPVALRTRAPLMLQLRRAGRQKRARFGRRHPRGFEAARPYTKEPIAEGGEDSGGP
jgi:hypothetical protein